MYELNLKDYKCDSQFESVIKTKGLEYPEAPKGGFEPTAVDTYTRPELMVPATGMIIPDIFMGFAPVPNKPSVTDFTEEFLMMLDNGGDINLQGNVDLTESFASIKKNTVLDLNGKTITTKTRISDNGETTAFGLVAFDGAELVINGDGKVINEPAVNGNVVWAYGGDVTINSGYFENQGPCLSVIYVSKDGKLVINGGEFKSAYNDGSIPSTKDEYPIVNKLDADREKCTILIKGGKFHGFNPADNFAEGPNTNFVAQGYESVEIEPNVWEVRPVVE